MGRPLTPMASRTVRAVAGAAVLALVPTAVAAQPSAAVVVEGALGATGTAAQRAERVLERQGYTVLDADTLDAARAFLDAPELGDSNAEKLRSWLDADLLVVVETRPAGDDDRMHVSVRRVRSSGVKPDWATLPEQEIPPFISGVLKVEASATETNSSSSGAAPEPGRQLATGTVSSPSGSAPEPEPEPAGEPGGPAPAPQPPEAEEEPDTGAEDGAGPGGVASVDSPVRPERDSTPRAAPPSAALAAAAGLDHRGQEGGNSVTALALAVTGAAAFGLGWLLTPLVGGKAICNSCSPHVEHGSIPIAGPWINRSMTPRNDKGLNTFYAGMGVLQIAGVGLAAGALVLALMGRRQRREVTDSQAVRPFVSPSSGGGLAGVRLGL